MTQNNIGAHEDKKITSKEQDFSAWYQDVIDVADLAEHGPVKGTMIIKPYGYAIKKVISRDFHQKLPR